MKRKFAFILSFIIVFSLVACDGTDIPDIPAEISDETESTQEAVESPSETANPDSMTLEEYAAPAQQESVQISIEIGETMLYAKMYDSDLAREFVTLLPQTISMQRVGGGREFYGTLDGSLNYDEADSQTTFENGEIAYWYSGNGLCLLYNNQVAEPEVESGIIPMGKIISDYSILFHLDDRMEATVRLVEE